MTTDKNDLLQKILPSDSADLTGMSLLKRAIPIAEVFKGRLPTALELRDITRELGAELATSVLVRAIAQSELHGPFSKEVRALDLHQATSRLKGVLSRFEVTIVASNLFQSGREWGDHVEEWRRWARELGFTTDAIETDPRASVATNARIISEHLTINRHPHRILVTYGQGASEMRFLLDKRLHRPSFDERRAGAERIKREAPELATLRGWVNVCGSFGGARSSDLLVKNSLIRLKSALDARLKGRSALALRESATTFPLWKRPITVPSQTLVSSLIGLPLLSQIPMGLRASYMALAKESPNDGVVLALDAAAHPGLLVPVQGMSHRAESAYLEPMLKRLLVVTAATMAASLAQERAPQAAL